MKKITDSIFAVITTVAIIICAAVTAFHPPREISEKENRELAQFPEFTLERLLDGTFMKEFETYTADQFMWRDGAVSLKADAESLLGKKGSNSIHFGEDGYLISRPDPFNSENLDKNIDSIIALNDTGLYNITLAVIPTAFEIHSDKLPSYAYDDRIKRVAEYVRQKTESTDIKVCDTTEILTDHKDEYIFYRSDHHQTALGSYYVYEALGEALDYKPHPLNDFEREILAEDFRGTSWSKAGLTFAESDTIEKFTLDNGEEYKQTVDYPLEDDGLDSLYAEDKLETKDKYSVYLGGNHGLTIINSDCNTGKSLMIFKDSYAHSIAPFLANHYETIYLVDLRYYSDDIIQYMGERDITDVLVLYNAEGFMTDTNLVKLGEYAMTSSYFDPPPFGFYPGGERVDDSYFADAAFFGDSLMAGYSYNASVPGQFVCKASENTQSVQSGTLLQSLLNLEGVSKYYIMLGINEVSFRPVKEYTYEYSKIIQKIREKNPNSVIYILSLLPVARSTEAETNISKAKIDAFNEALVQLAETDKCYYLNVNGIIAESDGYLREGAASDGIHVGAKDHAKMEDYLKTHAVVDRRKGNKTVTLAKIYTGGGNINTDAFSKEMLECVPFKEELAPVKENVVARMFDLTEGDAVNGVVYTSGGSTAEEFAAFEAESPEKAQELGEKLKARIEKKKQDFDGYKPEEMPKLNDPVVIVDGCLAAMCISDDNGAAETVISHY